MDQTPSPTSELPYDFSMGSSHSDPGYSTSGLSSPEEGLPEQTERQRFGSEKLLLIMLVEGQPKKSNKRNQGHLK